MRETSFDKSGNLIKEIIFGAFDAVLETYRNYNRFVEYKNGQRNFEYNREDFVSNYAPTATNMAIAQSLPAF